MAKTRGDRGRGRAAGKGRRPTGRSVKRQSSKKAKRARKAAPASRAKRAPGKSRQAARPAPGNRTREAAAVKRPRLDRARRILTDNVPTPPSSLNLDRRASAARSGRAEMQESQHDHENMSPEIAAD